MKKMFALFLAMMMVMSLAACGGNSAGNGSSAPEPENPVNSVVEGTNDAIEASGLEWKDISMAFCASTTGNDTMKVISEAVKGAIEAKAAPVKFSPPTEMPRIRFLRLKMRFKWAAMSFWSWQWKMTL